MKKILVVHNFYRNKGGEDTNILEELEFLKEDFEVYFYSEDNLNSLNFFDILSFLTISNYRSNKKFVKLLNKVQPDLVYIHNTWFKVNLGIFKVLKKRKIRTALKIHNFRYECSIHMFASKHLKNETVCYQCGFKLKPFQLFNKYFKESYLKSFFLYLYSKKYFKIMKDFPISIIALNQFHKNKLIDFGIDQNKIEMIFNPINFQNYNSTKLKENIVVYAGRISEEKGVDEILKSWQKSELKNFELIVIGDGEDREILERQYKSKDIMFLGHLEIEEVLKIISKAKAVVVATKLYEGQPRVLCEASSLGTLSIYPSFGGMDEFFPKDYEYSFEQFNYEDLVNKFNQLEDTEKFKINQENVLKNIYKKLNKDDLKKRFLNLM